MTRLNLAEELQRNPYPGRGIVLGRSADDRYAVIVYFIMGRSLNSRNRVFTFVPEDNGIKTEAFDPKSMEDPSLIIYHPVRCLSEADATIVTNGDQTDTIRDGMIAGQSFAQALQSRCFEPDPPNYTPRISGVLYKDGHFTMSILKSAEGDPCCCCRYSYDYDAPKPGEGRFIHTYQENTNPLPSFEGEPRLVDIASPDAESFCNLIWSSLNEDNKVSLFVRYIDLETGKTTDCIKNKNTK